MKKYAKLIAPIMSSIIILTGCNVNYIGLSPISSKITAINGIAAEHAEKNTKDNGSAKFNINNNHVDMTNFSFDTDAAGKIQATIEDEDLVFAKVIVYDGENNIWQNITDGHYKETFNQTNIVKQFNNLYQQTMHATDSPISKENIIAEGDMLYVPMSIDDGFMFIIVKNNTDKFINIAYTTPNHRTEDILNAATEALGEITIIINDGQESSMEDI